MPALVFTQNVSLVLDFQWYLRDEVKRKLSENTCITVLRYVMHKLWTLKIFWQFICHLIAVNKKGIPQNHDTQAFRGPWRQWQGACQIFGIPICRTCHLIGNSKLCVSETGKGKLLFLVYDICLTPTKIVIIFNNSKLLSDFICLPVFLRLTSVQLALRQFFFNRCAIGLISACHCLTLLWYDCFVPENGLNLQDMLGRTGGLAVFVCLLRLRGNLI